MKKNEVITMYNERIKKYGDVPQSVGWKDEETQSIRFKDLLSGCEINENNTILDLGCGFGSLLQYLNYNELNIRHENYLGVDFSEDMVASAQRNHPNANFQCCDMFKETFNKFDLIFCSGALNIKLNKVNLYDNLEKFITKFLPLSKIALSFNIIHDLVDYKDGNLNYYNLPKVVKIVSVNSRSFHIKNNSRLFETTITILKN